MLCKDNPGRLSTLVKFGEFRDHWSRFIGIVTRSCQDCTYIYITAFMTAAQRVEECGAHHQESAPATVASMLQHYCHITKRSLPKKVPIEKMYRFAVQLVVSVLLHLNSKNSSKTGKKGPQRSQNGPKGQIWPKTVEFCPQLIPVITLWSS